MGTQTGEFNAAPVPEAAIDSYTQFCLELAENLGSGYVLRIDEIAPMLPEYGLADEPTDTQKVETLLAGAAPREICKQAGVKLQREHYPKGTVFVDGSLATAETDWRQVVPELGLI